MELLMFLGKVFAVFSVMFTSYCLLFIAYFEIVKKNDKKKNAFRKEFDIRI